MTTDQRMSDKRLNELGLLDPDEPTESATLAARRAMTTATLTVDGSSDEQLFRRAVLAELRAIRELIQRAGYR